MQPGKLKEKKHVHLGQTMINPVLLTTYMPKSVLIGLKIMHGTLVVLQIDQKK